MFWLFWTRLSYLQGQNYCNWRFCRISFVLLANFRINFWNGIGPILSHNLTYFITHTHIRIIISFGVNNIGITRSTKRHKWRSHNIAVNFRYILYRLFTKLGWFQFGMASASVRSRIQIFNIANILKTSLKLSVRGCNAFHTSILHHS